MFREIRAPIMYGVARFFVCVFVLVVSGCAALERQRQDEMFELWQVEGKKIEEISLKAWDVGVHSKFSAGRIVREDYTYSDYYKRRDVDGFVRSVELLIVEAKKSNLADEDRWRGELPQRVNAIISCVKSYNAYLDQDKIKMSAEDCDPEIKEKAMTASDGPGYVFHDEAVSQAVVRLKPYFAEVERRMEADYRQLQREEAAAQRAAEKRAYEKSIHSLIE